MKLQNNNKGFSLIELMVVVGIIGVLASIAVPNFLKFKAKAKQSNAKVELAGLYTAQKAFYVEYSSYHGNLPYVGYIPEGCDGLSEDCNNQRYYQVGFSGLGTVGANTIVPGNAPPAAGVYKYNETIGTATDIDATEVEAHSFIAGASGSIGSDEYADDQWRMNQNKVLVNAAAISEE